MLTKFVDKNSILNVITNFVVSFGALFSVKPENNFWCYSFKWLQKRTFQANENFIDACIAWWLHTIAKRKNWTQDISHHDYFLQIVPFIHCLINDEDAHVAGNFLLATVFL